LLFVEQSHPIVEIVEQADCENKLFDYSQAYQRNQPNVRDEVSESKQMLFRKYLGDQHQIQKFNELKTMLNYRFQKSDDAISSNYPNSIGSTVRDFTSSSLASALNASPSTIFDEKMMDEELKNSWKQLDEKYIERNLLAQHKLMANFHLDNKLHEYSDNEYQKSIEMGNISDSSPSTVISLSHRKSDSIPLKMSPKVLNENRSVNLHSQSVERSPMSSLKSGSYSRDHYELARNFGSVLKTIRKPGHHTGPVKNPSCHCETCKRWYLERDETHSRERSYSFGETPITRSNFWRRNNRYYV
jgi:hypothetical protein